MVYLRFLLCIAFCVSAGPASTVIAAESRGVLPAVNERFAGEVDETPDFQRHVAPLLGRLGCNGRACHGSFQGRGGFRLSLFGYDFKLDYAALTKRGDEGPRVDRESPDKSLILRKPTEQVDHEGGERFGVDSWEYRLLKRWIESGAEGVTQPRELDRLEIEPKEIVFSPQASQSVPLRVTAVWANGDREDVTPLCRFRTNDDSVVEVDQEGRATARGPGDTHVIAFYDNGVAAVPVLKPAASLTGQPYPPQPARTKIDQFVLAKLRKLQVVPSPVCSDAEFLRRVSIDLTGTLPTPDEIESFLADTSTDKRRRKVDQLLDRPAYAAWWTNKLCDFTGCNPREQAELGQQTAVQWYRWIFGRVRENTPYDQIVERIVVSTSREAKQPYGAYARKVTDYFREEDAASFAKRETMPHYWTRRTLSKPEEKALAFAHNFLGVRLQCAQCHKHPFAPWTQDDFQQFSKFFENVRYGVVPEAEQEYRELAKQVGLNVRGKDGVPVRPDALRRGLQRGAAPWRELFVASRDETVELGLLRGGNVKLDGDEDPRVPIMRWMKQADNPFFARAFVNRVWAGYFHVGLIEPTDDLSPANPPSHPELLDWLTQSFIESGYDMKWLHRVIVTSDAYQRSWRPKDTNRDDRRNFSRAVPRRIPAEVVYDAVKQAVAASSRQQEVRTDLTRRASGHLSMWLAGTYGMHVFGKPERTLNCDCERMNQPTLLQSIFMQNDPLIEQRLEESGWIEEIAALEASSEMPDREALLKEAWLRTVGRPPTEIDRQRGLRHLESAESLAEGVRDLLWALINTKEFILNR